MNLEIEPQIPINLIQNNHFLQMSKDKQLSELELAKKEIESLKRKNEELQTENSKIPKLFEDYKLQDETFLKSVQRRLSYQHQHAKKPHDILTTYSGIIKEIDPKISPELKAMIGNIRGNKWPFTIKACLDYNTAACELAFSHDEKASKQTEKTRLHICQICLTILSIGAFHPSYICPLIKTVDQEIEEKKQQELLDGMSQYQMENEPEEND